MREGRLFIFRRALLAIFTIGVFVTSASAAVNETVLHAFDPNPGGLHPYSGLISDTAGNLYGTTAVGGTYNVGAVFELSPRQGGGWTQKVLHSFNNNGSDGYLPYASLIFDAAGNLYGTTAGGGTGSECTGSPGCGTVFELSPGHGGSWTETVLYSFDMGHGAWPFAGLIFDAHGNLYGTTVGGGAYWQGTVFELSPGHGGSWTETVLYSFAGGADGEALYDGLIFDTAGNLYGTTYYGGGSTACLGGCGTVFKLTPTGGGNYTEAPIYRFQGSRDGEYPNSGVIMDSGGNLYGTTQYGGTGSECSGYDRWHGGCGTVFELSPGHGGSWTESVLYSFSNNGSDGTYPLAGLVLDANGDLYGTTQYGGTGSKCSGGCGTVFELKPRSGGGWTEMVLHSFNNNGSDGSNPYAGLTFDTAGNLYGTTWMGGSGSECVSGCGTVFELSPRQGGGWTEALLYSFNLNGTEGCEPYAGLVFDGAGNLYGATYRSGTYGHGTVFELSHGSGGWTETVLHNFNLVEGAYPNPGLIVDGSGNLYGTTHGGGAHGYGTVFEFKPGSGGGWTETVLHNFNWEGSDGAYPCAGLVFDRAGNLYGTTMQGGTHGYGTVFELSPGQGGSWTETVLYNFNNNGSDGTYPGAGLVFDANGNLYGTTNVGGAHHYGTVFELSPGQGGWTEALLHSFNNDGIDGIYPVTGVIVDAHGNLYGTTVYGGMRLSYELCRYGCGTVFELSPNGSGGWTENVLHSFNNNGTDGADPYAALILDAHGNLYGTTNVGGAHDYGTVFELSPGQGGWTEAVLYSFNDDGIDGIYPMAGVIVDAHGNLYGTTELGGAYTYGTVFEVSP